MTTPTTPAALGSTDAAGYGTVAGVFTTFRAIGLTVGIAIIGAIPASFGPGAAFARDLDIGHHAAFIDGFSTALTVNAANALLAAALATFTMRPRVPKVPQNKGRLGSSHRPPLR
ncbi:MAG: hypothetical protein M3P18_17260 [Actinomycetota bacterium]|nr:hypothetical protein [Actinomycetota bacterium]